MAYFTRFAGGWDKIIIAAIILTWVVDYLVRIYAWTAILDYNGFVNTFLVDIGVGAAGNVHTQHHCGDRRAGVRLPAAHDPAHLSLGDLDRALIDAGKDIYGGPRQTFLHVTLPRHGIVGGAVLTPGAGVSPPLLGGPNQT